MKQKLALESLTNDELIERLSVLTQKSRCVEAELIAHIGEVDHRRLYARFASSMFVYCRERLHFSEHEAYLRIEVARASRKHPVFLDMLADGRLHLSGISIIRRHLTERNRETLLKRAAHRTKREIEELVAELNPKPDVPSTMRKLPERKKTELRRREELGPDRAAAMNPEPGHPPAASTKPPMVTPIAPARYKITFTASAELHDKLQQLRSLMRSSVPDGDLAAIIEEAVTEKLERLEAKRYAKTKTPRKSLEETNTTPSTRHIPAAVKRAVVARDRQQCTHVDPQGRRCTERTRLEFHHVWPYGRGGDHSPENIALKCAMHNRYQAEIDFGKDMMERYRRSASRVSEPAVAYGFENRNTTTIGTLRSSMTDFPMLLPHEFLSD